MMKDCLDKIDGRWVFDKNVTDVFSDMISRSIPDYDTMRDMTFRIGRHFMKKEGIVADIGCSNGLSVERFVKEYPYQKYFLYDVSVPMLNACRDRFKDEIRNGNVYVEGRDLRESLGFYNANLCISSLTIQFTPIEYRQRIIQNIYDSLCAGGGFIFIEKVLSEDVDIDDMMVADYYDIKQEHGYSISAIANKRKSLEGALVPLLPKFNEALLHNAGFKKVDCFWRCLNFMGWIAIK